MIKSECYFNIVEDDNGNRLVMIDSIDENENIIASVVIDKESWLKQVKTINDLLCGIN